MESISVKLDDLGRIVIPKKIRNKFFLRHNDVLLLSTKNNKIILEKENIDDKYQNIITKLKNIEKKYKLKFILKDEEKIIYGTGKYNKYQNIKVKNKVIDNYIENQNYYSCMINDSNNKGELFIIFIHSNKEIAKLVIELLSY